MTHGNISPRLPSDTWGHYATHQVDRLRDAPVFCFPHRNYSIGMHDHEFVELNLVIRGHGRHFIRDVSYPVAPGHVLVIPPGIQHGYQGGRGFDVQHLLLHPAWVRRRILEWRIIPGFATFFTAEPYFRREAGTRYSLRLSAAQHRTILQAWQAIEQEGHDRSANWRPILEALADYTIHLLCRYYSLQYPPAPCRTRPASRMNSIHAALALMQQRYADRLTLTDLARAAHMQKNYFCLLFRRVTSLTPMEYLTGVRLESARRRLLSEDTTLTQIAVESGFYDSAHFSKVFSKAVGIAPLRYRRLVGST